MTTEEEVLQIIKENRDALLAYLLSRPMAEVEGGVKC